MPNLHIGALLGRPGELPANNPYLSLRSIQFQLFLLRHLYTGLPPLRRHLSTYDQQLCIDQ